MHPLLPQAAVSVEPSVTAAAVAIAQPVTIGGSHALLRSHAGLAAIAAA